MKRPLNPVANVVIVFSEPVATGVVLADEVISLGGLKGKKRMTQSVDQNINGEQATARRTQDSITDPAGHLTRAHPI